MGKLTNLLLGGIVAASLATSGCYEFVYIREQPRHRVIYHEHPRNDAPLLIICYEWPSHDRYCRHEHCYDQYLVKLRNINNQRRERERQFQYQPEKQAFPHEPKVERRGTLKLEIKKGETQKQKQSRRAFPKEDD